MLRRLEKEKKRQDKLIPKIIEKEKNNEEIDDSIFSDTPSQILGKEKRLLLNKVQQYKKLFPKELKSFRVKRNASSNELQSYIEEMEVIVSTQSVDEFLTEGILMSLKTIEGISSTTKNYNLTGLTDLLKANPHFRSLCQQLCVKYGVFNKVSPEYQMLFMVITTAWICRSKNMNKDKMNEFLNQPIHLNNTVL